MSSGFIPAGTADAPTEHKDEWLAAQQEIEANRRRKAEESRQADGKSLYEILQANKAAKQDAFEESIRLKNQFRALDEDEVEFLDSVLESTRAQEARVRRETAEGLEAFRRQQEDADKKLLADAAVLAPDAVQEDWVAAGTRKRKRKLREKDGLVKGVKLRKSTTPGSDATAPTTEEKPSPSEETKMVRDRDVSPVAGESISDGISCEQAQPSEQVLRGASPAFGTVRSAVPKSGLCLVDYGTDEE